ncbi:DsbA family protein [Pyrofollis japonicus]|uniref:DsbA family protein n=1 Tax=Pyrofollis japonicus TaxID=3060460 RepID=UPI00295ABC8A|nr:DsbA family protein [Pyrofollis japonicus]
MRSQYPLLVLLISIVVVAALVLGLGLHIGDNTSSTASSAEAPRTSSQTTSTTNAQQNPTTTIEHRNVFIVEIGDPRCPHCKAMEEFFERYSSRTGIRSYFCSVLNSGCAEAFWALYKLKATQGVPTIVACSKDGILFVEVGELRSTEWWNEALLSSEPRMEGKIHVYLAGDKYGEIDASKELYQVLCTATINASELISPG